MEREVLLSSSSLFSSPLTFHACVVNRSGVPMGYNDTACSVRSRCRDGFLRRQCERMIDQKNGCISNHSLPAGFSESFTRTRVFHALQDNVIDVYTCRLFLFFFFSGFLRLTFHTKADHVSQSDIYRENCFLECLLANPILHVVAGSVLLDLS